LEVTGRITDKWDVFFNYAYMRAKIDKAAGTAANTQGMTPRNTPKSSASLWTTYKLPYGFKVGAGIEYVGKRYANDTESVLVGGYTRVDALVEYNVNKWLGVKLNVKNLLNRKYYEGVYQGNVTPGTPRAFELSLTAKF
jgi:catecholate siderophore receptor